MKPHLFNSMNAVSTSTMSAKTPAKASAQTSAQTPAQTPAQTQTQTPAHYHKCLGKFGYLVRKCDLTPEDEADIKRDLTVVTTVLPAYKDFQKPKTYHIYNHSANLYYLPRFYGIRRFGDPEYTTLTAGTPIKVTCSMTSLAHQASAIAKLDAIFDGTKELGDGGVLSLPCGYGKTFCAIRTMCRLGVAGLIVVPTECLMEQWMEAIKKFVPGAKVGYIQQNHIDTKGYDFVVAMLHSLCLKDYPVETFDHFGITIFDECHHIGSEVFCRAMMKIRTKFVLGLSATPNRRDGLSRVFFEFIGPLFHKEKRAGSNTVIVKKFLLHSSSPNYAKLTMANGVTNTSGMITAVSKLEERNELILYLLGIAVSQGRKTLLLSSRKDHLHKLKDLVTEAKFRRPDGGIATAGLYYGKTGMTPDVHKKMLKESAACDVVLGIDVIAKEGLDIPDLNTLIFATPPGMDVEQPVGRILRKYHKDINPYVVDLVDNTGNFKRHFKEREDWYNEEDYLVQEREVELLGDSSLWKERVCDYMNRKIVQVVKKRVTKADLEAAEREAVPDFSNLLLAAEDDVLSHQPTPQPKPKVSITITKKQEPRKKLCLLPDAPVPKEPKAAPKAPNFGTLLL